MISVLLIKQIVQLFIMMFCGYLLVRLRLLKPEDSKILSILLVYIFIPCSILNAFQLSYTPEVASGFRTAFLYAVIIHILLFALVYGSSRIFHYTNIEKASLIYSNAGNLIIPLVSAILGEEWVIYASAFLVVQLFIIWTHGKSIIQGQKGADLKAILLNVNLIACVIGLATFLLRIQYPDVIAGTVKSLGSIVGPVSMIMIGIILAGVDLKVMVTEKRIWLMSVLKMAVIPLIVVLIMKYAGFAKLTPQGVTILYISLMATMTPSASTVTQMAQLYDQDVFTATAINTITTLMCIVTMPILTAIYYM